MAADQALKPESTNTCCTEWKKKCLKLQESRNALRQAVKVLEQKINEIEAQNVNLKKAYEQEKARAETEKEEKLKETNARKILESEACRLESENSTLQQKCSTDAQDGNDDLKTFRACISDREKEINSLKDLLEKEKARTDFERTNAEKEKKKASEAWKILEEEKNKMQNTKIEALNAEGFRLQVGILEKEANEAKTKLVSEVSKFRQATKRFEAEKQKLLADKKHAESEMVKAQERLEVEKQKGAREKRRADAEIIKVEEQKKLAEESWKKAVEEKRQADKMSHQLAEDKRKIEDLEQKIHELSSLRKPIEMCGVSPDISANAENTKMKLLENRMKLEKLRAKHARQKFKLEASRCSTLQHELGHLKLDLIQLLHRLDVLDVSPVAGSIDDLTKSGSILNMQKPNVMRSICSLNLSQVHSQCENEILKPCCTTMDAYDPLRKNMMHAPLLALSGGNCAESITGINSKLEPLGSKRTKLQSSAVNSSTASFSDGQLMGSQERGVFPVTASAKLAQENFNARASMPNPSDITVIEQGRKRKRILDTVEYFSNLTSEGKKLHMPVKNKLSDLHGLLNREVDKLFVGGKKIVSDLEDNLQVMNDRTHKKRKKSHRTKEDIVPWSNKDEEKGIKETKAEVCEDLNKFKHTSHPASYTVGATQMYQERICDTTNNFDMMINFDEVDDGNYMKLLDLENAADEECYRRAMNSPLSPFLPVIEVHEVETFDVNNSSPFLEEALHEDMLNPRGKLFTSHIFDVIDVEINSNERKLDDSGPSSNLLNKPEKARKAEVVKMLYMHTPETSRAELMVEGGIGSLQNQPPKFCIAFSNIDDSNSISRIICAAKNCIARCRSVSQTGWMVHGILTALKMEEKLLQKEKVSVLFSLLLFNFTKTISMEFGKLWDGNLIPRLNSYTEHIRTVISDAETGFLFFESYSLHELLCLFEDFLIRGRVIVTNIGPGETLSECHLRANVSSDGVNTWSSEEASSEQLVAGSIILATVCAATDHLGFICEASYNILRFCRWDSLIVLTILHIFAYLGGAEFFNSKNFGLMVTVLKSLIMFLEDSSLSVATASQLPSINQLHTELFTCVKCPFSEGAVSIDIVASSLLETIKNCLFQGVEITDSSNFRFLSNSSNAGKWSNHEEDICENNMNCGVDCCLKKYICSTQADVLNNASICHLSDVLSLVELIANKMSWYWTDSKLVSQLLKMLDSCVVENFTIAIIVLLGQLGRLGVDTGGYEDKAVENLRRNLFAYLHPKFSKKAGPSLQIAAATALFGLLPPDIGTLLQTNSNLPAYSSKCASEDAENFRMWFSGLGEVQQEFIYSILTSTDVYK